MNSIVLMYGWWTLWTILGTTILFGGRGILGKLGLTGSFIKGFGLALICVLPMILSAAIMGELSLEDPLNILKKTVLAGLMEELLFRAFLFGLLFRFLGWGFIPAAVLSAVIFGLGHIYQGNSSGTVLAVFAITAIGSAWFAWLYIEWQNNLWVPIFFHMLMNASWLLFQVSETAVGGLYSNIFRAVTIALSVLITIYFNKKKGSFAVNALNLWRSASIS